MDYNSIENIVTSAPVIYTAIVIGSSAVSIYVYEHYFSSRGIERARHKKEVRLSREATKREHEKTLQQKITLENKMCDTKIYLENIKCIEDEKKHAREKEIINLRAAKEQALLEIQLDYNKEIARTIVSMEGVIRDQAKTYAIAAATMDHETRGKREKLRNELWENVNEEIERRTTIAEKIVDEEGEGVYTPEIVARVEEIVNKRYPLVEGPVPPLIELLFNRLNPRLRRDSQESRYRVDTQEDRPTTDFQKSGDEAYVGICPKN